GQNKLIDNFFVGSFGHLYVTDAPYASNNISAFISKQMLTWLSRFWYGWRMIVDACTSRPCNVYMCLGWSSNNN
ncbi:MAG: hypothetical protein AAF197_07620, partial [Pseudomonadota bacterium]